MLNYDLKRKHGIDKDTYNTLLKLQNEKCLICQLYSLDSALAVDHNHETGMVRGLLCRNCNLGLGYFKDNITSLMRAILYLLRRSAYDIAPNPPFYVDPARKLAVAELDDEVA